MQFLKKYFSKVFIGVWRNTLFFQITVKKMSYSGKITVTEHKIDLEDHEDFKKFMIEEQKKNPLTYIGFMNLSHEQGIIPTCEKDYFHKFKNSPKKSEYDDFIFKCIGENWNLFSSRSEIIKFQNKFNETGYDYLFSPFSIIFHYYKEYFKNSTNLYVSIENEFLVFAIIKDGKIQYGKYLRIKDDNLRFIQQVRADMSDFDNTSNKDSDIEDDSFLTKSEPTKDVDEFDKHENSSSNNHSIELNDSFDEDLDDMGVDDIDLNDEMEEVKNENRKNEFSNFGNIQTKDNPKDENDEEFIFETIQKIVMDFYEKGAESGEEIDFVENCHIVSSVKIKEEFLNSIEEELGMKTKLDEICVSELLTDLIQAEVKFELDWSKPKNHKKSKIKN